MAVTANGGPVPYLGVSTPRAFRYGKGLGAPPRPGHLPVVGCGFSATATPAERCAGPGTTRIRAIRTSLVQVRADSAEHRPAPVRRRASGSSGATPFRENPCTTTRPPSRPTAHAFSRDAGLSRALAEDILLRRPSSRDAPDDHLADKLHISINIVDTLLTAADRKLIEYDGWRAGPTGQLHRGRPGLRPPALRESRYAGRCRSRRAVHRVVRTNARRWSSTTTGWPVVLRLVISDGLFDQLGPAIHGDGAMFLYGPPGTGKSSVAERIVRPTRTSS